MPQNLYKLDANESTTLFMKTDHERAGKHTCLNVDSCRSFLTMELRANERGQLAEVFFTMELRATKESQNKGVYRKRMNS